VPDEAIDQGNPLPSRHTGQSAQSSALTSDVAFARVLVSWFSEQSQCFPLGSWSFPPNLFRRATEEYGLGVAEAWWIAGQLKQWSHAHGYCERRAKPLQPDALPCRVDHWAVLRTKFRPAAAA